MIKKEILELKDKLLAFLPQEEKFFAWPNSPLNFLFKWIKDGAVFTIELEEGMIGGDAEGKIIVLWKLIYKDCIKEKGTALCSELITEKIIFPLLREYFGEK